MAPTLFRRIPAKALVKRIKTLLTCRFSKKTSHSEDPLDTPCSETQTDRPQRCATISSSYAEAVDGLSDSEGDWMLHASPTATLAEKDTAPQSPIIHEATQQPKKKRRPVSMPVFSSLVPPQIQTPAADYRAQAEQRRRSVALPFTPFLAASGVWF